MKYIFFVITFLLSFGKCIAQTYEKDTIFTNKNKNEIIFTFIQHGSLMMEYNGINVQIDPVSDYADYYKFPKADLILLTHEHPDHLDSIAINILSSPNTKLITNASCSSILKKGDILKNGESIIIYDQINIKSTPAYNTTKGREFYHPKYRDNGYLLTIDETNIYIAGDTEDIPEMKLLNDIDVAFIPVNQPYTMNITQAIKAAKMINPKILYPYHYNDSKVYIIKEKLSNSKIDVRIRKMN